MPTTIAFRLPSIPGIKLKALCLYPDVLDFQYDKAQYLQQWESLKHEFRTYPHAA